MIAGISKAPGQNEANMRVHDVFWPKPQIRRTRGRGKEAVKATGSKDAIFKPTLV